VHIKTAYRHTTQLAQSNHNNISTTNKLSMTKKKVQASTLKTMPMSPPTGGRRVPRGINLYDGTKEEEIEALNLVFRVDGRNPYKDDTYNTNNFHKLKPIGKHDETQYHMYLATLYDDMNVENCYVAIADMMRHKCINNTSVSVQPNITGVHSPSNTTTSKNAISKGDNRSR
jgi:hypothetical protein